jgi:hypothetical protein
MSSDEPLVIEGRFWLPNDRYRSYGRLEYDAEHGVHLHLVDTNLSEGTDERPQAARPIDVLYAETLGGSPLTVLGLYPTNWSMHGAGPAAGDVIDGFVQRVLRGVHLRDYDELVAPSAVATLHGLREFLVGGQVDGGPLPRPTDNHRAEVLSVEIDEDVGLLLAASRQGRVSRDEEQSKTHASAQWTMDPPLSLPRLERDYVGPLQDLILFATRRQSYLTGLTAHFHAERPWSVEVLQQPYPRPRDSPPVYALALNLRDHGDPPTLIAAWYALRRKVGPVWDQFFGVLDRPESLLEDRLLGIMSFAEGYHRTLYPDPPLAASEARAAETAIKAALKPLAKDVRRIYKAALGYANSLTQRERLEHLTSRAFDVLGDWWDLDPDVLCAELSDTRNWLIHWGKPGRNVVKDDQGMSDLVRRLIVVMYVNLLLDLGLDRDAATKVIGSGWRLEGLP